LQFATLIFLQKSAFYKAAPKLGVSIMNMKNILSTIILMVSAVCIADAPLRPPEGKRFCDYWMNYCGYTDPESGTEIYKVNGKFQITKLYSIEGWHRAPYLSFDGVYFVSGYGGLNLIPLDTKPSQVMLTIFKNGELHKEITLGALISNMKSLEKTSSHLNWGYINSVNNYSIELKTVEGRAIVSLESGLVEYAH
jgi:hypothetical protein